MARTLICTLLLLAGNATAWAQILDVRELNTDQIARLDRARTVVLLTAGILEEHGPFLPSYSDGYQSEFIATRVAEAVAGRSSWTVLRFPDTPLGAFPGQLRRTEVCLSRKLPGPHGNAESGLHGSGD